MNDVADAYHDVQARIRAACQSVGRAPTDVTLVAVSKRQPDEKVLAAYTAGARDFGENYIQALTERRARLGPQMPDARWHFIGRVQTNKAKLIATCDVVHGAGSQRHIDALLRAGFPGTVFLQVDVVGEAQKNGVAMSEVAALWAQRPKQLVGLMTMGQAGHDARPTYEALARQADEMAALGFQKAFLSMGMSADFEAAVQAGATHVRVGSAIFGARS